MFRPTSIGNSYQPVPLGIPTLRSIGAPANIGPAFPFRTQFITGPNFEEADEILGTVINLTVNTRKYGDQVIPVAGRLYWSITEKNLLPVTPAWLTATSSNKLFSYAATRKVSNLNELYAAANLNAEVWKLIDPISIMEYARFLGVNYVSNNTQQMSDFSGSFLTDLADWGFGMRGVHDVENLWGREANVNARVGLKAEPDFERSDMAIHDARGNATRMLDRWWPTLKWTPIIQQSGDIFSTEDTTWKWPGVDIPYRAYVIDLGQIAQGPTVPSNRALTERSLRDQSLVNGTVKIALAHRLI